MRLKTGHYTLDQLTVQIADTRDPMQILTVILPKEEQMGRLVEHLQRYPARPLCGRHETDLQCSCLKKVGTNLGLELENVDHVP